MIKNGAYSLTGKGKIGDWPLAFPMLDINTVGTGGGSIATVSETGALTVGPASAGADPGPACYGRGSEQATITDAHLVLGHLPPYLLAGGMQLDEAASRKAIEQHVGRPLGLSAEDAAQGILAIADNDMVGAIRVISVERGHDPRDFALIPFGGAGPCTAVLLPVAGRANSRRSTLAWRSFGNGPPGLTIARGLLPNLLPSAARFRFQFDGDGVPRIRSRSGKLV